MNQRKCQVVRVLIVLVTFACSEKRVAPCFNLNETRRLGYAEPIDSGLDSLLASAGVLGDIRGVVVGPNGEIHVLDRTAHRIVVFGSDGKVKRSIRGGEGEGPGEFRLPMHLAATGRGLSVIDYDLRRLTEFDWSGKVQRITRLRTPAPWRHLVRGDTAWISYAGGDSLSGPAFHIITLSDERVIPGRPLEVGDQPFGVGVGVAFGTGGEILVNTARPGVWMVYDNGQWTRRGQPIFPEDRPPGTEQTGTNQFLVTPAQHSAAGIAMLGDSIVLQGVGSYPRPFDWNSPPRRDEFVHSISAFRTDGEYLTTLSLPADVTTAFMTSHREAGRFYLPVQDPYPQVIEYTLVECRLH